MQLDDRDIVGAFIHLYRGEVGRMTAYRARLDTTTNWAVGTTAAIMSFALSDPDVPHFAFVVALALNGLFLWLEARRYRVYGMIRHRVRLIERGFYARVLGGTGEEGWEKTLAESLQRPSVPVSYLQACSVRLRRNYIWLALIVYVTWIARISVHRAAPEASVGPFTARTLLVAGLIAMVPLVFLLRHYRPPEEG